MPEFWTKDLVQKYKIRREFPGNYQKLIEETCREQIRLWSKKNDLQNEVDDQNTP